MTSVIEGDIPTLARFSSGLYGLDHALGFNSEWGLPLRSLYEVYGHPGVGKSSLCYYLASKILPVGKVLFADLEGTMDGQYLLSCANQAKFDGVLKIIDYKDKKGEARTHESMIQEAADALTQDDMANGSVVDSIGMFQPIAEREGDIEEAFVGRRALAITKFARRASTWLRVSERPKALFVVNHVNPIIGGRGHATPGGQALKYAASVRLMMYREQLEEKEKELGVLVSEVSVEKLRYGGSNKTRKALVAILPGIGLSPRVTAMYDCFQLGLAKREAFVKVMHRGEWKSVARIGVLLEDAMGGDVGKFAVFEEILGEQSGTPG